VDSSPQIMTAATQGTPNASGLSRRAEREDTTRAGSAVVKTLTRPGPEGRASRSRTFRCGWYGSDARRAGDGAHRSGPSPGGSRGSRRLERARTRMRLVDRDHPNQPRARALEWGSRVRSGPARPAQDPRCRACSMSSSISARRRRYASLADFVPESRRTETADGGTPLIIPPG